VSAPVGHGVGVPAGGVGDGGVGDGGVGDGGVGDGGVGVGLVPRVTTQLPAEAGWILYPDPLK